MKIMPPLQVMVTRPNPGGEVLCQLIRQQGDEATHFPTIAIVPPTNLVALQQGVAALSTIDWLIFISPQAVLTGLPVIQQAYSQWLSSLSLAAIGTGTAALLREAGCLPTICPPMEWNSEGLLALPEFATPRDLRIAIVRGEGGRELLEKTLASRGATVLSLITYRRVVPTIEVTPYLDQLKNRKIDVIVCASYEAVHNLKEMIGKENWPFVKNIPLIVMSARIKNLAEALDFQTIWATESSSQAAILALLEQKRNDLCQMRQKQM